MRTFLLARFSAILISIGLAGPGLAQDAGLGVILDVNRLIATGDLDGAERQLETAFLTANDLRTDDRISLLDRLADVQSRAGKLDDLGDTLWNKAALIARENGPDAPELAPVYAAAGDAYLEAGLFDQAVAAYEAALRLDQVYLECDSPALAQSYAAVARALAGAGKAEAAQEARVLAQSPEDRCAKPNGGRGLVAADEGEGGFASVDVFYGTDRKPTGALRPNAFYGRERGPVDYGRATVTIPRTHKPGQVESPSLLKFEWRENPALHVVLTDIARMDEQTFFHTVAGTLDGSGSDEVFVFVHGFNTTFSEAAKRTAQIAYDLNFEGVPLFYAWPSRGSTGGYLADAATVQVSARHLVGFLEDVVGRAGADRIHLMAHSMGSRALTEALELYAARHPGARAVFQQVIFAAPDVDADLFALQVTAMRQLAERVTLYASSADLALSTSRRLHGDAPRAGQGGPDLVVAESFDTVDMTTLGDDMLKHTYFASDSSALADILWLFWRNPPPDTRCGMQEQVVADGVFWVYRSDDCDERLILPAITLARRFGSAAIDEIRQMVSEVQTSAEAAAPGTLSDLQALQGMLHRILN